MRIPDIEDIYDAYERRQAQELEKYPKCEWCENHITDERLYVIDGELVCEKCIEERHKFTDCYMNE